MALRKEISEWFDTGIKRGSSHMIVVCDIQDHEDYPVYVQPGDDVRLVEEKRNSENMQKVIGVYNLQEDKEEQLNQEISFNY